jgi:hypothetical protein
VNSELRERHVIRTLTNWSGIGTHDPSVQVTQNFTVVWVTLRIMWVPGSNLGKETDYD